MQSKWNEIKSYDPNNGANNKRYYKQDFYLYPIIINNLDNLRLDNKSEN